MNLTINCRYGMRQLLSKISKEPQRYASAEVFLCYMNDKLVGWSAIAPATFTISNRTELWVYTRRTHRRKGLGTLLYKKAKNRLKRIMSRNSIAPWNEAGYEFFKAQGIKI